MELQAAHCNEDAIKHANLSRLTRLGEAAARPVDMTPILVFCSKLSHRVAARDVPPSY